MHISKNLKRILARAPVLLMMLSIITVCHPVRAQAEEPKVVLRKNMPGFVSFVTGAQDMDVIETKGSNLKEMFKKADGSPISGVKDNSQYFAYYKIDTKATNSWTWSTAFEYWHKYKFKETANGNITVPQNPSKSSNVFFTISMEKGNKGSGCGKQSFTRYRKSTTGTWHTVGRGETGTLHYFCIDDGTAAGNALRKLKAEQGSKDNTVDFYVSPVIHNSEGPYYFDLNSWYTNTVKGVKYYWADTTKSHYKAHYNNLFRIEIPTVKVTQNASLVGKKLAAGNDAFWYQTNTEFRSDNSRAVRKIKSTDYIFRPQFKQNSEGKSEQVLLKVKDLNGETVTGQTVDYYPFEDEDSGTKSSPVELKSPVATKNTTNPTITYKVGDRNSDKWQSAVLVGFTVYKKVDTNDDGQVDKKIFIANTIVQMKQDTSGQFRPKYVEEAAKNFVKKLANEAEESGQDSDDDPTDDTTDGRTTNKELSTKQDTTDGDAIAVPSNVLDWHVTLKKYSKRKKSGDKLEMPTNQVTLKYLGIDLNGTRKGRKAYLRMNKSQGIRNEDKDTTKEIVVDWLYAPVDTPPTVTLEQYYVDSSSGEKLNYSTKEDLDVREVDSVLKYNHKDVNQVTPVLKNREVLAQVNYGDPWVSYSVKRDENGAYKLKDGSTYPKQETVEEGEAQSGLGTKFKDTKPVAGFTKDDLIPKETYTGNDGKTYEESYIPLVVSVNGKDTLDSCMNNYLYEVRVKTEYDGKWTRFTAKDIWGDCTRAKGKLTDDRGYVTSAAYMKNYVYGAMNHIKNHYLKNTNRDWQKDAYNMTHFIIPECRGNVTVQAFYTTTVPIRVLTYVGNDNGGYSLDSAKQNWCTAGQTYHGSYDTRGYKLKTIFNATGEMAYSSPYSAYTKRPSRFASVHDAQQYFPERHDIEPTNGTFTMKVPVHPCTIVVMLEDSPPSKYFTQVQYVHTKDGKYHYLKSWTQIINTSNASNGATGTYYTEEEEKDEKGKPIKVNKKHEEWHGSNVVRAFVSFPQYVSYDEGNAGLYGSLYKTDDNVYYEYDKSPNLPVVTDTRPGTYITTNNNEGGIYLTKTGHDKYVETGDTYKADSADRTIGGDNTLVCYAIYEDIFDNWNNEQYNPKPNVPDDKNPKTEEKKSFYWNWVLPNGFVWDSVDIEKDDTVDETKYENEYTSPFIAQVMGTNTSAVFDAQRGIPTTEFVRTQAQVPRYLTRGYYNKEMIDWAYKIYAVYVKQTKSAKTIEAGNNDNNTHDWTKYTVNYSYDYYKVLNDSGSSFVKHADYLAGNNTGVHVDILNGKIDPAYDGTIVERHGVYYVLGDAEVWDPYKVTMYDDVFCDVNKTYPNGEKLCSNGLVTLYGYGNVGGYASQARFFKLGDGRFELPKLSTVRQYVNYGTYDDWAVDGTTSAEKLANLNAKLKEDLKKFKDDADSIVGKIECKNDTITFFDGLGTTHTLSDGEKRAVTKRPSIPPEADLTSAGIFDSKNTAEEGIQVQPYDNNGHHETRSIAYYKQIQCFPTEKYKTDELIKTKIADDGDDDVLVYTPTYCGSQLNLDYNLTETDSAGIKLSPNDNYDQAVKHDMDQTISNIQLDREYTMTLSCTGEASDLPGYGYQDYTRYLKRDSNGIPVVQVKFPFPVWIPTRELQNASVIVSDGTIKAVDGDLVKADDSHPELKKYYYANTWIDVEMIDEDGNISGIVNQTIFIPSWATEDEKATITFRSIALNCDANCPDRNMQHELTNDYMTDAEDVYDTYYSDEDGTPDPKQVVSGVVNKVQRNEKVGWVTTPGETGKEYRVTNEDTTEYSVSPFDERDYIAYKIEHDTVTGRVSDFQVFDVSDYPAWQSVFREYDQTNKRFSAKLNGTSYHSGICDRYGYLGSWNTLFTTPIVGASNPTGKSNGTIGLGYKFRFKVTTVGPYYHSDDCITITPKFYFMDDNGKYLQKNGSYSVNTYVRQPVDVYYCETTGSGKKTLVRVGSEEDKYNRKSLNLTDDVWQTGSGASWQVNKERIDLTNNTLNNDRVGRTEDQYSFGKITMTPSMRLLCGDTHVSAHRGKATSVGTDNAFEFNSLAYGKLGVLENKTILNDEEAELLKNVTTDKVLKSVQEWYGEYYLPSEIYVTTEPWDVVKERIKNGFDGSESCWLKSGRIVINFNPTLSSNTKPTLKYNNSELTKLDLGDGKYVYEYAGCDQYKIENFVTSKVLTMGEVLPFGSGDTIVYDMTLPNTPDPDNPTNKGGPPKAPAASDAYGSSGSH